MIDVPRLQGIVRSREDRSHVYLETHAQPLTPRQLDIARLIADGHTDREIAAWLHISHGTVRTHTQSILRRTDTRSRAHAVAVCIRRGWI